MCHFCEMADILLLMLLHLLKDKSYKLYIQYATLVYNTSNELKIGKMQHLNLFYILSLAGLQTHI